MLCLDTNVVIGVIGGRDTRIRARFNAAVMANARIAISSIVVFELRYGIAKSNRAAASDRLLKQFLASIVDIAPFELEDAAHAGDIRAHLERAGTPIGPYDLLIAAQARRRGATLVTGNKREFLRVPGLKVDDWAA